MSAHDIAEIGFFGKLPALGDFVSRELSRAQVKCIDDWMQLGLRELQSASELWLQAYLVTPVWQFLLPRGEWYVRGEHVDPSAIRNTALLSIEGELDDIAGLGQTEAAQSLCTGIPASRRSHLTVEGAGHYGIFTGRRWREVVYPEIRDFIVSHAQAPAATKPRKKAVSNVTPLRRRKAS